MHHVDGKKAFTKMITKLITGDFPTRLHTLETIPGPVGIAATAVDTVSKLALQGVEATDL